MRWRGESRGEDMEESFTDFRGESVDEVEEESRSRILPSCSHSGLDDGSFDLAELNAQTKAKFFSNGHATLTQMACPQLKPRSTTSIHAYKLMVSLLPHPSLGRVLISSELRCFDFFDAPNSGAARNGENSPFASAHSKVHFHEEVKVSDCEVLKSLTLSSIRQLYRPSSSS